jgi:hypothetical protein
LYNYIPFYWTRQWDKSLQFLGSDDFDDIHIEGNLKELTFTAYFIKNNIVVGFCAMNTPNAANIMYEAFRNNITVTGRSIKEGNINFDKIKQFVQTAQPKCSKVDCCKNKIKV